jgi:O-antigen/teichoic acid export membrane protein
MTAGESQRSETSLTTFKQAAMITLVIGCGSVVFFLIFQKFVLGLFFGVKYLHVSGVLVWFALMASLYSLANLFLQYLLSLHQTKVMKWFLIGAIIEVIALYFFGKSLYTIVIIATSMQIITMIAGFFFIRNAVKS